MKQFSNDPTSATHLRQPREGITKRRQMSGYRILVGFLFGVALTASWNAQAQGWPWISSAYISYSTYWFKNITTSPNGSRYISTTYSTGNRSTSNGSSYARTRTNTNGVVSVMNGFWIQTDDNYYATTNFQSPNPNGSTYTSAERHTAEFAADYSNPSQSGVYIEVEIRADLSYVSSTGSIGGSTRSQNQRSNIMPGNSGRITLGPSSGTQTNAYDADGMYYTLN